MIKEHLKLILFKMKKEKEKILDFARELFDKWEITKEQLNDTYFNLFIKKRCK